MSGQESNRTVASSEEKKKPFISPAPNRFEGMTEEEEERALSKFFERFEKKFDKRLRSIEELEKQRLESVNRVLESMTRSEATAERQEVMLKWLFGSLSLAALGYAYASLCNH